MALVGYDKKQVFVVFTLARHVLMFVSTFMSACLLGYFVCAQITSSSVESICCLTVF